MTFKIIAKVITWDIRLKIRKSLHPYDRILKIVDQWFDNILPKIDIWTFKMNFKEKNQLYLGYGVKILLTFKVERIITLPFLVN